MTTYRLEMRDDGGCDKTAEIEADTLDDALGYIIGECEDWAADGEWGDEGASVDTRWELYDGDEKVDEGSHETDIEPNHNVLIKAAGGDPDCEHDWTGEGHGGCDENPGVWSTGGTSMEFLRHCRKCGLHRREYTTGSQRNPGEHDTVKYEQPDNWCTDCQAEECVCDN